VTSELLLLGHRGDPLQHPENTMAGFVSAVACGADGVELDVQVSGDGVAVVIHDDTVDRTTAASGRVDALTWPELRHLGVPRLDDVLAALRDSVVAVELKASHAAHPDLAERVLRSAARGRMLLLSFDHAHLAAAKRVDSTVRCGALVRHRPADPRALLDACNADALALWWEEIDAALCAELDADGRAVFAWTVDGEADAMALARMGVAVVISNRPCALAPVLRSFRAEG
jgi:glycerophosphoryl diester phosphodiesterase